MTSLDHIKKAIYIHNKTRYEAFKKTIKISSQRSRVSLIFAICNDVLLREVILLLFTRAVRY